MLVDKADSEGKATINFKTFLEMLSQRMMENNTEEEIKEAFRVFDKVRLTSENKNYFKHKNRSRKAAYKKYFIRDVSPATLKP